MGYSSLVLAEKDTLVEATIDTQRCNFFFKERKKKTGRKGSTHTFIRIQCISNLCIHSVPCRYYLDYTWLGNCKNRRNCRRIWSGCSYHRIQTENDLCTFGRWPHMACTLMNGKKTLKKKPYIRLHICTWVSAYRKRRERGKEIKRRRNIKQELHFKPVNCKVNRDNFLACLFYHDRRRCRHLIHLYSQQY